MKTLKDICVEKFPLHINRSVIEELVHYTRSFELKKDHPLALNTSLLGAHLLHFPDKDQVNIFNALDVDRSEFSREIAKCTTINKAFKVISNPYNLFTMWVVHNILKSTTLSNKQISDGVMCMGKLMVYRFFASLTNHRYKYGVNEEIMRFTIDNLSGKYSIKQKETNTWKKVIEQRVDTLLLGKSIHTAALKTFSPDDKITYVISDLQSRIRDNVNNIHREYMSNKEHGDKISSYGIVDEINGEKNIRNIIDTFPTMISKVSSSVLNINKFLDNELIKLTVKLNGNLREDMFRDILTRFSNMSLLQYRKHDDDKVIKNSSGSIVFVGYHILVSNIIQKTYRKCILRKIDMKSKIKILEATKNIYSNSRINDADILNVKNSIDYFVDKNSNTNRDQTKTALKLGLIIYVILLSMK